MLKGETFEKCFPLLAGFKVKSKIPDFEGEKTSRQGGINHPVRSSGPTGQADIH